MNELFMLFRLAVARIEYYSSNDGKTEDLSANPYKSTDPAPPFAATETSVAALKGIMLDSGESLFRRYRDCIGLHLAIGQPLPNSHENRRSVN